MEVSVKLDPSAEDIGVEIICRERTPDIERLEAYISLFGRKITVMRDGGAGFIDVREIMYIEAIERKTFVYTSADCLESKLKLYEMENELCSSGFLRVSKACLVNLKYVKSLKNEINRKIRITLDNGEQLIASRFYADELRRRLEAGNV